MIEIMRCVNAEAYKASLILCGSVLEALIIDWLSEVEEVDHLSSTKSLQLYQAIERLSDHLEECRPKAHKIRERRNLVHPRRMLQETSLVDEKICREVLDDLRDVLSKRTTLTA